MRDFKKASSMFLESLATFTCFELHQFPQYVFLTVISSILSLDRPSFKSKIIDSPDVLSVLRELPELHQTMNSLYDCSYRGFFEGITKVYPQMLKFRHMAPH